MLAVEKEIADNDPLSSMRNKAWDHLEKIGFPTRKSEVFRYIKLKKLYETKWSSRCGPIIEINDDRVDVIPLNEAISTFGGYFNHRFAKSLKEETDPFALLNAANHQEGVFIYVPPNTVLDTPLRIAFHVEENALIMPRIHVFVGTHSQIKIELETKGDSEYFLNSVIDCHVEENAHVKLVHRAENHQGFVFDAVRASLKRNSFFSSVCLTDGSECFRSDYRVALLQEGAEAHLNGVCQLKEAREAHVNILMEHLAPNCRSRQLFKSVLEDVSRSSFEGKIYVEREAQQTDAFQLNNNLVLSERAQAYSKPNLEIFADDVKASHGATIGQLDEDELFYMRTRGMNRNMAEKLLKESFCQEVLDAAS